MHPNHDSYCIWLGPRLHYFLICAVQTSQQEKLSVYPSIQGGSTRGQGGLFLPLVLHASFHAEFGVQIASHKLLLRAGFIRKAQFFSA